METRTLHVKRAFIAATMSAVMGIPLPWLLGYTILSLKWWWLDTGTWDREFDLRIMSPRAWLLSWLFASVLGAAAFSSFGVKPKMAFHRNLFVISSIAVLSLGVYGLLHGPWVKSEPEFGEKWIDIVWLTLPAIAAGLLILGYSISNARRLHAREGQGPTERPP
jgi:hypothetical protein